MSEESPVGSENSIIVFGAKQIRRIWSGGQWFFSVVDIIAALTDSANPRNYWNMMKAREREQSGIQLSTLCVQLKLASSDGKSYRTDCVNVEAAFRIIQSIPSPKAEPFKQWLARVGYERVQEIENPELAQQRMRTLYKEKGYPDDWIEKRVRGIAIRDELTGEWQQRGIADQRNFAILTAEISKATFGITPFLSPGADLSPGKGDCCMQPEIQKARLTQQWLGKARRDLLVAERLLAGPIP